MSTVLSGAVRKLSHNKTMFSRNHFFLSGVTDLENNSNQKKYTVNKTSGKKLVISKPLCTLMAIGAILLAVLVGLVVFFVVPRECNREKSPESLTSKVLEQEVFKEVDERLPRRIEPTHYR